jgi:hypothetical protein
MSIVASILASSFAISAAPSDITQLEDLIEEGHFINGFIAGGTGCVMAGDPIIIGDSITLILTDYIVEKEGVGFDQATCDLAVEVDLPPGLTASLDSVTYRGFADGFDATSIFYREYFFADEFMGDRRFTVVEYNSTGDPTILRDDSSNYVSDFGEFTARDDTESVGHSPCGELVLYRTNTSLSVRNLLPTSIALASIDTVDVHNEYFVTLTFGVEPCGS